MRKLKQLLTRLLNGDNKTLTLVEIRDIERIYNDLLQFRKAETIMQKSADICKDSNLTVNTHGIGWIIRK